MSYTAPHYLITVGGDSWSQTETWQFGVRARIEGVATPEDQQLLANALAAPTQTYFLHAANAIISAIRLTYVKVALLDFEGHYGEGIAPGIYTYPAPVPGTNGSSGVIPQHAIAVTTLTAVARGRASKGRWYLPPNYHALDATGLMSTANCDAMETAAAAWITAINATAQVSNAAVMSKIGAGTTNNITAVGVGRVVDTMRSRRRSLAEGRTPTPI